MKISNYINEIEKLISNGDTESACKGLIHLLEGKNEESHAQIILLLGQFSENKRNQSPTPINLSICSIYFLQRQRL